MNFSFYHSSSSRRVSRGWLTCAALVFFLLAACGKKGPLYLPDDAPPHSASGGAVMTPSPDPVSK
jgi:predicted small lipoprotein YifL